MNDLHLSIHNPALVYAILALYGVMTLVLFAYVHAKFRTAARALKLLEKEWQSAESKHAKFVGMAHETLSKWSPPTATAGGIGPDKRNQIAAMAKRGISVKDIARNCGLQEGEVEVIVGLGRL